MKVAIINKAKAKFNREMKSLGRKFTDTCIIFVRELAEGVDDGDTWELISERCFGEKLTDLEASLQEGNCSNVPQYKAMISKALHMYVCQGMKLTKLTPMADAYDKLYEIGAYSPNSKNKTKGPKAKAKAQAKATITISASDLMALVMEFGLSKAEATKLVKKAERKAA